MSDISFHKLVPQDLKELAAVAQTLDNQWVPRHLLDRMIADGLSLADVRAERHAVVRTEYLRAVLNAEQLVINRAYFINNLAVIEDFAEPGPAREAFKRLLSDAVLVPFLYGETSPVDSAARDRMTQVAERQWSELAAETEMSCVRLSWTDSVNRAAVNKGLAVRFHEFVAGLKAKCLDGGDAIFASHLGVPQNEIPALRDRLSEVAAWAFNFDKRVFREDVYREFVVAEGSPPTDGRYDPAKRFAAQLKQLVDLAYNTTLPETLDRYPLRPEASLHRAALQEWKQRPDSRGARTTDADAALDAVIRRRTAFDIAAAELPVPALADLDLGHVARARATDEWLAYRDALADLVTHPEAFADKAGVLQRRYAKLLDRLAVIAGPQPRSVPFSAGVGFNLDFSGVLVKVRYFAEGAYYRVFGTPPPDAPPSVGMSRAVISGEGPDGDGARRAGHHLAADLQPFVVEEPAELLRKVRSDLAAAGIREVGGGSGARDGGLEQDLEDNQAA
ncbi:hypothetical protein [Paractinoplanes rishiriensis]|uniref:hypothetical protein n=1 Tax=Paractinoplanes rishiriensis TaxID=1050105 RepID=UPI001945938A|nr:hypothetical protein [Actinoplanes rishiriensis]